MDDARVRARTSRAKPGPRAADDDDDVSHVRRPARRWLRLVPARTGRGIDRSMDMMEAAREGASDGGRARGRGRPAVRPTRGSAQWPVRGGAHAAGVRGRAAAARMHADSACGQLAHSIALHPMAASSLTHSPRLGAVARPGGSRCTDRSHRLPSIRSPHIITHAYVAGHACARPPRPAAAPATALLAACAICKHAWLG
jgi:hypothetical protein